MSKIDLATIAIQRPYDFTLEQVTKLCEMQDTLNTYIHPDWKWEGFDWSVAIQDEIMEIREHLGWKWWKAGYNKGLTADNIEQVRLEVIDILHFVVSSYIEGDKGTDELVRQMEVDFITVSLTDILAEIVSRSIDGPKYLMQVWADLARHVGLTEQMILETYAQKYTLNKFRQDNGYKDGTYCKVWQRNLVWSDEDIPVMQEDNEVLADIVAHFKERGLDSTDEIALAAELKLQYSLRLNQDPF